MQAKKRPRIDDDKKFDKPLALRIKDARETIYHQFFKEGRSAEFIAQYHRFPLNDVKVLINRMRS